MNSRSEIIRRATAQSALSLAVVLALGVRTARAEGVYDEVAYWNRGAYNCVSPALPQLDDTDEYPNALYLNLDGGHGRLQGQGDEANGDRLVRVAGFRRHVYANETLDIPMPYAQRLQKNRAPLHLTQYTYQNPGDDTVYGFQNYVTLSNPFSFENTNAWTVVFRLRHESYVDPTQQRAGFANVGYGWTGNSGFYAELRGDPDNEYIFAYLGKSGNGDFTACQASPSTRLSTNKWIDVAFAFDPKVGLTVYTCPEGGGSV